MRINRHCGGDSADDFPGSHRLQVSRITTRPEIRRALAGDAPQLTRIAFSAKRHWGYPDAMIELWIDDLTVTDSYIETHSAYAAVVDSEIAGWYSIASENAVAMIDYCWVDPQWIGQGMGRSMLEHMREMVRHCGVKRVQVVSDPNAEGFYCRMGFETIDHYASLPPGRLLPIMEWRVT